MINALRRIFFFSTDRTWRWLFIALCIRIPLFIFSVTQHYNSYIPGFFGAVSADTETYIDPLENFLQTGNYLPDFRMPGVAIIYLPFRLFLSEGNACNAYIILQMIAGAAAVYFLARSVYLLTRSPRLFYAVFYLYALSTYASVFNVYFLTDGFCTSAFVFFIYCLVLYAKEKKTRYLFFAGLLFTWIIFLRQPYILFFILPLLLLVRMYRAGEIGSRKLLVGCLAGISSFLVIDGLWIARNYGLYHRFIPLRKAVFYLPVNNDYSESLSRFVQSWGGDIVSWNPKAEIRWFNYDLHSIRSDWGHKPELPDYIYTSAFNRDTLEKLKALITITQEEPLPLPELVRLNTIVNEKCRLYERSVREERPFLYYVTSRFILFKKFFVHSGCYNLFANGYDQLNPYQKVVKLFYTGLYWFILLLCFLGIFIFPYRSKMFLFFFPVFYTMIIFPFVFKFDEYRYIAPAYPFMLASACFLFMRLMRRFGLFEAR